MAITSSLGIGSGLDINGIVNQLVEADGQPAFNAISRRESAVNSRLSALGRLKSALSDFRTATGKLNEVGTFNKHTAVSSDKDTFTAKAELGSAAGIYSLEVQQLAKAHKLVSAGYADSNAVVGSGALTLSVDGNAFTVSLDATNNTLEGVRDAINQANDNPGVQASIINVDDGAGGTVSKLVLTSQKTGSANAINVTAVEDSSAPGLANLTYNPSGGVTNLTEVSAAQDAKIIVDGQTATRSSNTINDVIQGVTLDLKKANPGVALNLDVTLDEGSIKEVTDGFVSAYNGLMSIVKDLGRYDPASKEAGALLGDSTLRSVQSQVRQAVAESVSSANGNYNSLAMIGITIDRTGVMALDSTKFSEALKTDTKSVSEVFSSTDGVAARLDTRLDQYLQTGGTFDLQTSSLNKQLSNFSEERDKVQLRLDGLQKQLMKQFIAMDIVVGQFQSTGAYLAQQLAKL